MSLKDLLSLAALKDTLSWGGIAFLVIASLLQFSKININPWDKIFGWIGDRLNSKLLERLKGLETDMNGRRHTKEQFDFIIKECDDYESYIEKNDIKNGVVTSAIREIRRLNDKCIQENSFLKEREYD